MAMRPPDRPDPSQSTWSRDPRQRDPNQTYSGTGYRGGPMAPGPRPGASIPAGAGSTIARGIRQQRDASRSLVGNRTIAPGASLVGARGLTTAAAATTVAPVENLFTGNLRRLWLSEIASTAGDTIAATGLLIWFVQASYSLTTVLFVLASFAVPAALVTLFAGSLAGVRNAQRALLGVGILRVALALLFIGLAFNTKGSALSIVPFGLALASNLRLALRRGAITHGIPVRVRGMLASGDQVAAGVLAVAGPALATLLYLLNGEQIFAIAIGAAFFYLLALISESHATPLPDRILYQRPAEDEVHSAWEQDEGDADAEDVAVRAAEKEAAVWELTPPPSPAAALRDLDAGLQIAGAASHPRIAFVALAMLAFIGGMVALLEPFYVWTVLGQAPFVLGLFFAATGLGAAIGSAVVVEVRGGGRFFLVVGLLTSGIGLIALMRTSDLPHALGIIAVLGLANVFALRGGQVTMLRHFVPVGQRAAAQALVVMRAWLVLVGMGVAVIFAKHHRWPLPTLGLINLLAISGLCLIIIGLIAAVILILPNQVAPVANDDELAPLPEDAAGDDEAYSRYAPAADAHYAESARYEAYDSARYEAYDSARYEAYDSARYEAYRDDNDRQRR